ncbi:Ycf20-like protein, partial [Drosera capensis]
WLTGEATLISRPGRELTANPFDGIGELPSTQRTTFSLQQSIAMTLLMLRTEGLTQLRSHGRRHGRRLSFALNTDQVPDNSDQQRLDGEGPGTGQTRLSRIIIAAGRQLLRKLNSARKNFPMKIFLLLLGFYTANALATILGQTGDWDVLVAGVVVTAIEGIGMLMYKMPSSLPSRRVQSLLIKHKSELNVEGSLPSFEAE